MASEYKFPVWYTQGGGLVREVGGQYVFIERPAVPGLDIGDLLPDEWSLAAANSLAIREMEKEDEEWL